MNYYLIEESLRPCSEADIRKDERQFVAVLTAEEWETNKESFNMVIDIGVETGEPMLTKAVVNMDSLTGTFSRPALSMIHSDRRGFAFVLDETGIVLIDDTGYARSLVTEIQLTKKWRVPCLERFIYDLLELAISNDLAMLGKMEHRLDVLEKSIIAEDIEHCPPELNDIRGDLLDLRIHYEQLIDLGQEFAENENGFFKDEMLRFFSLFTERVMRLQILVNGQRDYVSQLRDLMQSNIDIRMNRIMTILTIITSIFLPLTLIAGWYGMNFRYMPELEWVWGYPMVIAVSITIVILSLLWFRKKHWL